MLVAVQISKLDHRAGKRNTSSQATMNPYYNLPPEQRATQRVVDQYNSDVQLWKTLEPRRRSQRKLMRLLPCEMLKELDLLEFARARSPQELIGFPIQ